MDNQQIMPLPGISTAQESTAYALLIPILVVALATRFKQVNKSADNFSHVCDPKELKELKEGLETQYMKVHIALSDRKFHDIKAWNFSPNF
jgi:hypothetical protein